MHLLLALVMWHPAPLTSAWSYAGQAQSPLDEDIVKAIDKLYSERHSDSEQGKAELIEIGKAAVTAVVGEMKGKRLTEEANKTKAPRVKRALCEVLGDIRDASNGAVDALIEKLSDKDEFGFSVASAAADALAKIGDEKAAPALLKVLQGDAVKSDPWLKYYTIRALGLLRSKDAVEEIKKALGEKTAASIGDEKVHLIRVAAADALGRIRAENVGDEVAKLLLEQEQNPFTQKTVSWHAARALERILKTSKGALEGDDATVKETLAAWAKWADGEVGKRNIEKAKTKIKDIASAVDKYKADLGQLPLILGYLHTKPPKDPKDATFDPEKWKGPYLKEEDLTDPWSRLYMWNSKGTGAAYDIYSWGRDQRQWGRGDDADIWNHDAWRGVKRDETKKAMDELIAAVGKFKEANGRFPTKGQELMTKPADAKNWPEGGYVKALPKDAYGGWLFYECPGTGGADFNVYSLGPDNAKGGVDENEDLWNHDKWKTPSVEKTRTRMEAVVKAIETFKTDNKRYPDKLADLKVKPTYAKGWKQSYTNEIMQDDFGNDFAYTVTDADKGPFELKSLGGDGKAGGAGADEDIVLPKK